MIKFLIIYLVIINIIAIFVMRYDKKRAIKKERRVPEKTLFTFAFLGASLAIYLCMQVIRHKNQKPKFRYGIPLLFLVNVLTVIGLILISRQIGV
ncbi:MAG: DUF1294 domain-containing protein [Erysipelotrichales bacterium]|nr:DUF1294 domain-containing protein [Erysipelotrichales bacterium]